MDPTADELARITSVGAAGDWARLAKSGPHREAFLSAFGVEEEDPPRVLAMIPEDDYSEAVKRLRVAGEAVPPGVLAKATLVGRVCRLACGLPASASQAAAGDQRPPASAPAATVAAGAPATAAEPASAPPAAAASAAATAPPVAEGGAGTPAASLAAAGAAAADAGAGSAAFAPPPEEDKLEGSKEAPMELDPVELERQRLKAFDEKLNALTTQRRAEEGGQDESWDEPGAGFGLGFAGSGSGPGGHPPGSNAAEGGAAESWSVYITGLDSEATPTELQEFFKACGGVKRVTVLMDKRTSLPKGAAYVEMAGQAALDNALLLNGCIFRGHTVQVQKKKEVFGGGGGKPFKGKGKGKDDGYGKSSMKGKPHYTNKVFRPNQSAPY